MFVARELYIRYLKRRCGKFFLLLTLLRDGIAVYGTFLYYFFTQFLFLYEWKGRFTTTKNTYVTFMSYVFLILPFTVCNNKKCETEEGEDCSTCPYDCGRCPLPPLLQAMIIIICILVVTSFCGIVGVSISQSTTLFTILLH